MCCVFECVCYVCDIHLQVTTGFKSKVYSNRKHGDETNGISPSSKMSLKTTNYPKKKTMMICFDCICCVGLATDCALGAGVVVVGARGSVDVGIVCVEVVTVFVPCAGANASGEANVYCDLDFSSLDVVEVSDENRSGAHENPFPAQNRFGIWVWVWVWVYLYQQF